MNEITPPKDQVAVKPAKKEVTGTGEYLGDDVTPVVGWGSFRLVTVNPSRPVPPLIDGPAIDVC